MRLRARCTPGVSVLLRDYLAMKTSKILLLTMTIGASLTANAADWKGQGEAGIVVSSGNTDSENANVGLSFINEGEVWTHELGFGLYRASNNDIDSAESFNADYTIKRDLSERRFIFGSLSFLDDEFDGFTEQVSLGAGYGYRIFDTEPRGWEVGAGIGFRDTSELSILDDGSEIEGEDLSGATLILRSDYRQKLTSNTEFQNKFVAEIGSDNTYVESDTALLVAMNEAFSLKAGVLIRHNTDPAEGADETDTITSINLVYNFNQ